MENSYKNVSQFDSEDILMSIKTEPEVIYEREDNANSTSANIAEFRDNCISTDSDPFVKIMSKIDESKEDTQKLRELLKLFGLEDAWPFLKSAQVTYRCLQYMRKEDLKEAIPPLGLRIEFREKFFNWRKRKMGIDEDLMPTNVEDWLNKTPSYSSCQQPQEQPTSNSRTVLNKDLRSVLMDTTKGKQLLKFYEEYRILNESNRNDLNNIIIEEIVCSNKTLQQKDFFNLVDEICTIFPTEKDGQEYYFIPRNGKKNPSGKLYSKYVNSRARTKNRKLETMQLESPSSTPAYSQIDNIHEMSEQKDDLSGDTENWNEIQDKWKSTFQLRQMDLKAMTNDDFLKAWPKYTHKRSPELIQQELESYLKNGVFPEIFNEYSIKKTLSDSSRRCLVRESVNFLRQRSGNYPSREEKIALAEAIIVLFPAYKVENSDCGGIDLFFNPANNTGYLVAKLKNLNSRRRKLTTASEKVEQPQGSDIVCENEDISEEDLNFFQNCLASDQLLIKEKLQQTLKARINYCTAQVNVLQAFPIFVFDSSLILFDFELRFGEFKSKELFNNWEKYKHFVDEIGNEAGGHHSFEIVSDYSYDVLLFFKLLKLLPSTAAGRDTKRTNIFKSAENFISFEQLHTPIENYEVGFQQPTIIAVGKSKSSISQYFLSLQGKCINIPLHYNFVQINIDFTIMHPLKESSLFSKWDAFKEKIKNYYELSIHNDNCMQLFMIAKTSTNNDSQDYIFTTLLNAILPPNVRFKNNSGKCTKKVSIADAQESFALRLNSINDYEINIEHLINKYYSAEVTILQPFLIIEGALVEQLENFYIYFNKNLYKFETFTECLDTCFKIFQIFSIPYPKACEPLWVFIQQYFYDIYTDLDCKTPNLVSLIKFMKKSPTTSNNYQQIPNRYKNYSPTWKTEFEYTDDSFSEHYEPEKKRRKDLEKNVLFTKYFEIKEINLDKDKNNILAECRACKTTVKASVNVSSNFIRHLKVKHPNEFEDYIQDKISNRKKEPAKSKIDSFLIDVIIENMLTFGFVESSSFKKFINLLNPNYTLPSEHMLMIMFNERYKDMINSIKVKLRTNNCFCTTADVWCTKNRIFFTYTCHWIDPNSFKRISSTLSLKRFSKLHNYEEFKDIIEEIHQQFGLNINNLLATITDSGTNFRQIFKQNGLEEFCDDGLFNNDFDCIDIKDYLPQSYIKSAGHTLNLYASTDFTDILIECQLLEKHVATLQKCNALWLKSQNDIIKTLLGNTLKYPVITKWNSLYYSICEILKYKNNINDVCNALQLPKLSEDDFVYLHEYIDVNKPIAEAIEFLQTDNMLYGYLLPTLATIRMKITILLINSKNKKYFNTTFLKKLEEKLIDRFPNYFELNNEAESAIVASVLCPDVKLDWVKALKPTISNGDKEELARKVQNIIEAESEDSLQKIKEEELPSSSKYFQFSTQESSYSSVKNSNEFLTYMVDMSKNIEMLNKYPIIKKSFIKFNTPLPASSAPSDRILSYSGLEFTAYSEKSSNDTFLEQLVLLKINIKK